MSIYTNNILNTEPLKELKRVPSNKFALIIARMDKTPDAELLNEVARTLEFNAHFYIITDNNPMLDIEITRKMAEVNFQRAQTLTAKFETSELHKGIRSNGLTVILFRRKSPKGIKNEEERVKAVRIKGITSTFKAENMGELKTTLIRQSTSIGQFVLDIDDDGTTAYSALINDRKYLSFTNDLNTPAMLELRTLKKEYEKKRKMKSMLNRIVECDSIKQLNEIPDESVDLILTDPPYPINKQTANFEFTKVKIRDYIDNLYRVLKSGKHAYIMVNNKWLYDFEEAVIEAGFKYNSRLIWEKNIGIRNGIYFRQNAEFILFLSKGEPEAFRTQLDLVNYHKHTKNEFHATEKPVELFEKLLLASSAENDLVLEPFSGSGTTPVSATKHSRQFIALERSSLYVRVSNARTNLMRLNCMLEKETNPEKVEILRIKIREQEEELEALKIEVKADKKKDYSKRK